MTFAEHVENADRAAQEHLGSVDVIYEAKLFPAVTVKGIFDENYRLALPDTGGVETVGPAVFLKLADLPDDPREADVDPTLVIGGKRYRIRERQTDGTQGGGILLLLHREACS